MKKLYLFVLLLPIFSITQAQSFEWVKQIGSTSDDFGNDIILDASGNVYTTGGFSGTVDFDPGPGVANLTSGGSRDIFISKMNDDGTLAWAKQLGGSLNDQAFSIALDVAGNVYTTGNFFGTADFDPGPGVYNLIASGTEIFVSKLNADGTFAWAKQIGGISNSVEGGRSITLDASGNIYYTGYFNNTVDFDPGAGVYNLTSAGGNNIFVSKLNADGSFAWAKQMGGSSNSIGVSIALDAARNVFTTGYFSGTADFDPGSATYNLFAAGSSDIFVSKLNADGSFGWAIAMGSTGTFEEGNSIAIDATGNVYITGRFKNTVDFDPGPDVANLISAGAADAFICKFNADGSYAWANRIGDISEENGLSLTLDATGNIYYTGYFGGTVDFDPGAGVYNLNVTSGAVFVSKLNADGSFAWATAFGGVGQGNSIVVDGAGKVHTIGIFYFTGDFDPGLAVYNLTSAGEYDVFVQKMSPGGTMPVTLLNFNAQNLNSRVKISWRSESEINLLEFVVEKSNDGINFTSVHKVAAKNTAGVHNYAVFDMKPLKGNNFYRLRMVDIDSKFKYSQVAKTYLDKAIYLSIFPNPTYGEVIIQSGSEIKTISIIDINGKKIKQISATANNHYNINPISTGIYFIQVETNDFTTVQKLMIQ
ncbi:MAG TPA: SBBP repeat-containing protein [Ferruginibacter sp.]|nr:SBBP repeat-containing protein [Ferruginibacter sp.]